MASASVLVRPMSAINPAVTTEAGVMAVWACLVKYHGKKTPEPQPPSSRSLLHGSADRLAAAADALQALTEFERPLLDRATGCPQVPEIVAKLAADMRQWADATTRRGPRLKISEQALAAAVATIWCGLTGEDSPPRGREMLSERTRKYHALARAAFAVTGHAYTERLVSDARPY